MTSKEENIQNAILAIDAKVDKLLHRKEELKRHQSELARARRATERARFTIDVPLVGAQVSPSPVNTIHTDEPSSDVAMLLNVLQSACSGNWSEDSLPPSMLARLSGAERVELNRAISRHNSEI